MKVNSTNISFGSKYQIKGQDINLSRFDHLFALTAAIGTSKDSNKAHSMVFNGPYVGSEDYIFDIKDQHDLGFEKTFTNAGIRFNKLG